MTRPSHPAMTAAEVAALRADLTPKNPTPQRNADGTLRRWPHNGARKLDGQERAVAETVTSPGMTLSDAARKLGVSTSALLDFLRDRMPFVEAHAAWRVKTKMDRVGGLIALMAQGATLRQMADATGLSPDAIRRRVAQAPERARKDWQAAVAARYSAPTRRGPARLRRLWAQCFWAGLDPERRVFVAAWVSRRLSKGGAQ